MKHWPPTGSSVKAAADGENYSQRNQTVTICRLVSYLSPHKRTQQDPVEGLQGHQCMQSEICLCFRCAFCDCGVGLKLALATQKWQNLHCSQELTLPAEQSNYSCYITPVWNSVCERIWWGLTDGITFRSIWQSNTGEHVHEINQILTICNMYFLGLAVVIQKGWMSKSHTLLAVLKDTKKQQQLKTARMSHSTQ